MAFSAKTPSATIRILTSAFDRADSWSALAMMECQSDSG